ncbi:MAG: iron-sulfur cluster assembly protein [Verrucomicrobiota bacterium]
MNAGNSQPLTKQDVLDVLKNVYDPEIQISIVDLGLIYEVEIKDAGLVHVKMTLTSPGCPYGAALVGQVQDVLKMLRGVQNVEIELVFTPPWSPERMTQEARLELGLDV